MRRATAILLTLLVGFVMVAPAGAAGREVVRFSETYMIPEDLAEVEDPGELNHGCSGGLYTLVDGTFAKRTRTIYAPSQQAWEAGEPGATMTVVGSNRYRGLWDVDSDPAAWFQLRDNNIRYRFTFTSDSPDEPVSGRFAWRGRFIDTTTGDVAEWWQFRVRFDESGETGIQLGTCL